MKKIYFLIAVIIFVAALSGCAESRMKEMTFTKAKLSSSEEKIVNIIKSDNKTELYDYKADKNLKSIRISCYRLNKNGEWDASGGGGAIKAEDAYGRLAVTFNKLPEKLNFALEDKSGLSSINIESKNEEDLSKLSSASVFSADNAAIEYGKEIPIAAQVFTSKDDIVSLNPSYFYNTEEYLKQGHEYVYAVTVTFLDTAN